MRQDRLLKFARAVAPATRLTAVDFAEDSEGPSPLHWELRDFGELDRQVGDAAPEDPVDRRGFFRWRLCPTVVISSHGLDVVVENALKRACSGDRILIRRKNSTRVIRYRFLIDAGNHAHVGVLVFAGPQIEELLGREPRLLPEEERLLRSFNVAWPPLLETLERVHRGGRLGYRDLLARYGSANAVNLLSLFDALLFATKPGSRWRVDRPRIEGFLLKVRAARPL